MNREGDFKCLERLEEPVERVNNNDLQTLRTKDVEKRVLLWFEIKENLGKYEDGECGSFYGDVHRKTMAGFYMALLKLAATFSTNEERFAEAEKLFTRAEIELVQSLEKYNSFQIKSNQDIAREIRRGAISHYMHEMGESLDKIQNDPEIKLPVRDGICQSLKRWLEVLETGVLELMKQPGEIARIFKEAKAGEAPKQVMQFYGDVVMVKSKIGGLGSDQGGSINTYGDVVMVKSEIGGIVADQVSMSRRCPECKREAEKDDNFCPECGTRL
ncbi:zinc ribbon domain-containing protein [Dehalococcoidia bacterium]|nr:zinc ribbon domain-containing protein [Dehalococcoidia bacterium]